MPSVGSIEIRIFPRFHAPRVSPWFILWGLLFSALTWTTISAYIFPSLYDGTSTITNILGHIRSGSLRHDIEPSHRIAAPFDPDNADAQVHHGVVPRNQHSYKSVAPPSPTVIAITALNSMMAPNTISTTEKETLKPLITARPRGLHRTHRRLPLTLRSNNLNQAHLHTDDEDRYDDDNGFPHFGDDLAASRLSNNENAIGGSINTINLQDVRPFPPGEVNDIQGTFARCARPCMKKAVELNTDCEDPLDLECTCLPENRAVIEAASDECCWQACGHGVPEILWRPCWNEDEPLRY